MDKKELIKISESEYLNDIAFLEEQYAITKNKYILGIIMKIHSYFSKHYENIDSVKQLGIELPCDLLATIAVMKKIGNMTIADVESIRLSRKNLEEKGRPDKRDFMQILLVGSEKLNETHPYRDEIVEDVRAALTSEENGIPYTRGSKLI